MKYHYFKIQSQKEEKKCQSHQESQRHYFQRKKLKIESKNWLLKSINITKEKNLLLLGNLKKKKKNWNFPIQNLKISLLLTFEFEFIDVLFLI